MPLFYCSGLRVIRVIRVIGGRYSVRGACGPLRADDIRYLMVGFGFLISKNGVMATGRRMPYTSNPQHATSVR
jgi:hypothetical protein